MALWKGVAIGKMCLYFWNRMGRKDELCKLLVYAPKFDSVLVEFQDGFQAVTSAKALRPVPAGFKQQPKLDFGS